MQPTPQEVKQDVLVCSYKPPPSGLQVASHHNGLLEDLVVLVRATLLFGSQRAVSVCLRYPIPVGHCQ